MEFCFWPGLIDITPLTFLEPAKPSDSVKKYAKGMRKMRDRLEKRKTRFQRPRAKKEKQEVISRGMGTTHWGLTMWQRRGQGWVDT